MIGINQFIIQNDPVKYLYKLIDIITNFDKFSINSNIFNKINQFFIKTFKYPYFKYKMYQMQKNCIKYSIKHPDSLVWIINRFVSYFILYCKIFKIEFKDILNRLRITKEFELEFETAEDDQKLLLSSYSIITRFNFISLVNKKKFAITKLFINNDKYDYNIEQTVYDTEDGSKYNMADILYSKQFKLETNGKLYNPNYIFDKNLLSEDLLYFRFMIAHIMTAISSLMEAMSNLNFNKKKNT